MDYKSMENEINQFYVVEKLEENKEKIIEILERIQILHLKDKELDEVYSKLIPAVFYIILNTPNYFKQMELIDSIYSHGQDKFKLYLLTYTIQHFNSLPADRKDKFYYLIGISFKLLNFKEIIEMENLEVQVYVWKKINENVKIIADWNDDLFLEFICTCKPFVAKLIDKIKIEEKKPIMRLISQGAEGKLFEDGDMIIKTRESKSYRIKELDGKIIKSRVKKESKMLNKLQSLNIKCPKLIKCENNSIYMEKIDGVVLKDALNISNYDGIMYKVGETVASLHNASIIHGDLTTLNFIVNDEIYIIDFGLSFYSYKDEDKAVDLYVFERAIKCVHSEEFLIPFYKGYAACGSKTVLDRLEAVRGRGRKRENNSFG